MVNLDLLNHEPIARDQIVKQVRAWGDLNTDALLDSSCLFFKDENIEGMIGYRVEGNCAVVYGDPLCSQENKIPLAKAFQAYCKKQKYSVVYAIVSEQFTNSMLNNLCAVSIEFGERLVIDPATNPTKSKGSNARLVRKKVKHALIENVSVKEYLQSDPELEKSLESVAASWLASRHGPQIHIGHIHLFEDREGKRWFYAEHQGKIVGLIVLNRLQSQNGWLMNNLMITDGCPNGTSELLVITALEALDAEKCRCIVYGPVPSSMLGKVEGLSKLTTMLVRIMFKAASKLFRLDGQRVFWGKFQPQGSPSYILFDEKKFNLKSIKGLMKALNASPTRKLTP